MLKNIFNTHKKEEQSDTYSHITEKISKMNLTDMRTYVRNKIADFEVSEFGLQEIMRILIEYIKVDDMPSKKKKAFDLIILMATNKKMTIDTIENMQKFLEKNKEIIHAYDREFKEIYQSRLDDALSMALSNIDEMTKLQNKMNVLGE